MKRIFPKTKFIIAILFVASLLITFLADNPSDCRRAGGFGSEKSAVIAANELTLPFLPAGETEMEKLSSLLQRPVLPVRRTYRLELFSLIDLALFFAFPRGFFPCPVGVKFYEDADQFHKSVIAYIHHKGDQN